MKIGTKSVLFGAHQFAIHPWFVALAWWKLFGFPWDLRLWVAFFVHDLGYIGKPNMDGPEGEGHPFFGAKIMGALFGQRWHDFTLLHSRFLAKTIGLPVSRLCLADKLATALTPAWLYLPLVRATGEIHEYMHVAHHMEGGKYGLEGITIDRSQREWYQSIQVYLATWVAEQVLHLDDDGPDAEGVWDVYFPNGTRLRALILWDERGHFYVHADEQRRLPVRDLKACVFTFVEAAR